MNIADPYKKILGSVQVNVPFRMLIESYIDLFTANRINPEIGIDADALENFKQSDFERLPPYFLYMNHGLPCMALLSICRSAPRIRASGR